MSVVIHEVSHGYAALMLGDYTAKYEGRLTLNPLKHIDPIGSVLVPIITSLAGFTFGWAKPVPYNPFNLRNQRWGEAMVAFAGPLSNITIAVVFSIIIRAGNGKLSYNFIVLSGVIVLINLVLAFFNLIPVPPLDGSKILYAFLPQRMYHIRSSMERYGFFLVLAIVFLFWSMISPVIFYLFSLFTGLG